MENNLRNAQNPFFRRIQTRPQHGSRLRDPLTVYVVCSVFGCLVFFFTILAIATSRFDFLIRLTGSKLSLTIFINAGVAVVVQIGRSFLLYTVGTLRDLELEQIVESGKGYLLDLVLFVILATPTVDGEDVDSGRLCVFVGSIFVLKLYHLIAQLRVSHLLESGGVRRKPLIKMAFLLICLLSFDILLSNFCRNRTSFESTFYMWILFEALGLCISSISSLFKLSVQFVDMSVTQVLDSAVGWPFKNEYIFVIDVSTDILSLLTFLVFLLLFFISSPTRLPLYLATDIAQVVRTLIHRVTSFYKYRSLASQLETHFGEATLEEIEAADTCIICRDLLLLTSKKLPCGHIFHAECLKGWFVQHQTCPTCRAAVKPVAVSSPEQSVRRPHPERSVEDGSANGTSASHRESISATDLDKSTTEDQTRSNHHRGSNSLSPKDRSSSGRTPSRSVFCYSNEKVIRNTESSIGPVWVKQPSSLAGHSKIGNRRHRRTMNEYPRQFFGFLPKGGASAESLRTTQDANSLLNDYFQPLSRWTERDTEDNFTIIGDGTESNEQNRKLNSKMSIEENSRGQVTEDQLDKIIFKLSGLQSKMESRLRMGQSS